MNAILDSIQEVQAQNIVNRIAIQSILVPTVKINDDANWFNSVNDCLEAAQTNKADLIELLYAFAQEGDRDIYNIEPDDQWAAEIVASDTWTQDVHDLLWEKWDGNFDKLSFYISIAYNKVCPVFVAIA